MTLNDNIQLAYCDHEDINDIILVLERSFAIRFEKDALADVKTFGDLCDKFEAHILADIREDCTSQQAFYKIRNAISESQGIIKEHILPDSQLSDLFPRQTRRKQVRLLEEQLGIKLNMLTYPGWLSIFMLIWLLSSIITIFIDPAIAMSGIALFVVVLLISEKTAKELADVTVRELTERTTARHYMEIRRIPGTVNRKEVVATIKEVFSKELDIDKADLRREAKFSFAH